MYIVQFFTLSGMAHFLCIEACYNIILAINKPTIFSVEMKRKEIFEEKKRLKKVHLNYLDSLCLKMHNLAKINNNRVPHNIVKNLVEIGKPIFGWLTRSILNKHYK